MMSDVTRHAPENSEKVFIYEGISNVDSSFELKNLEKNKNSTTTEQQQFQGNKVETQDERWKGADLASLNQRTNGTYCLGNQNCKYIIIANR